MKTSWALQDAKNRFSEVIDMSLRDGPQIVTRHGTPVVVIMAVSDYQKEQQHQESLVQFFQKSPLHNIELDITRNQDTGRKVAL